jgi:hypothetical protein
MTRRKEGVEKKREGGGYGKKFIVSHRPVSVSILPVQTKGKEQAEAYGSLETKLFPVPPIGNI